MQEELESVQAEAPLESVTRAGIRKMMKEEWKNIQENDIDLWSDDADPRVQAFEQALAALSDLQYDSLEDNVASYAKEAIGALTKAVEELDYKRNRVGNDPDADAAREADGMRDPYGAPMREDRKRPLRRDRDAFTRNQDMVSGLQKTITSYLKEAGVKIKPRHTKVVEKMSTRIMHIANSPMIRLEEGIHYEGLMEIISDMLQDELRGWHQEAKDSLKQEIEAQGFDLTQQIMALIAAPL